MRRFWRGVRALLTDWLSALLPGRDGVLAFGLFMVVFGALLWREHPSDAPWVAGTGATLALLALLYGWWRGRR